MWTENIKIISVECVKKSYMLFVNKIYSTVFMKRKSYTLCLKKNDQTLKRYSLKL